MPSTSASRRGVDRVARTRGDPAAGTRPAGRRRRRNPRMAWDAAAPGSRPLLSPVHSMLGRRRPGERWKLFAGSVSFPAAVSPRPTPDGGATTVGAYQTNGISLYFTLRA